MDKDSFSAGLIVMLVIVLTGGAALFFNLNGQLTELKKSAAERDTLRKQLENIKSRAVNNDLKLAEQLEEIEKLHGHIGIIGECMDGVIQAWLGKRSGEVSNPVLQIMNAESPHDLRRNILMTVEEPCRSSYDIIQKSKITRTGSTVPPSLDSKVLSSR